MGKPWSVCDTTYALFTSFLPLNAPLNPIGYVRRTTISGDRYQGQQRQDTPLRLGSVKFRRCSSVSTTQQLNCWKFRPDESNITEIFEETNDDEMSDLGDGEDDSLLTGLICAIELKLTI